MDDKQIEEEIKKRGLNAPRVTLEILESEIDHIEIVTHRTKSLQTLRWAVVTMKNGFAVTGECSCSVSPENDDEKIGCEIATQNAKDRIWALMGYNLKQKIYENSL